LNSKSRELFRKYSNEEIGIVNSFIEFYLSDPHPWLSSELHFTGDLTKEVLPNNLKINTTSYLP